MPQVSRDLLVDLWYPGEIKPEPAEPASADGLLYMFLHRDAAGNTRGGVRHPTEKDQDRQGSEQTTESRPFHSSHQGTCGCKDNSRLLVSGRRPGTASAHVGAAVQTSWRGSTKMVKCLTYNWVYCFNPE